MDLNKSVIIDTDPGIDDALAIMLASFSPAVDILAITLVYGNVEMQLIKKNAVVILNALADSTPPTKAKKVPVLAVGASSPLQTQPPDATYFHGKDGLGMIYDKLYPNPKDWERQLSDPSISRGFIPTPRDAADEILHQLRQAPPLTCTLIALGPLTNLAVAYERDAATFSRARQIVIMGGAVNVPGNITAFAEFNFRCDPLAAKIIMGASRGFDPMHLQTRVKLLEQHQVAPCHVVLMPLDATEDGTITKADYDRYIVPLDSSNCLFRLIKAFMRWSFEATKDYYDLDEWAVYDAYAVYLALELMHGKLDANKWHYEYLDLTVETQGTYTLGMCCLDRREYQKDKTSWDKNPPNNVQTFLKADRQGFRTTFINTVFDAHLADSVLLWSENWKARLKTRVRNALMARKKAVPDSCRGKTFIPIAEFE